LVVRTFLICISLVIVSAVASSQTPETTTDTKQPAAQGQQAEQGPAKQGPQEILTTAHDRLEHGRTQEAIAMLEKLAGAPEGSVKGVQHALGIAYYRSGKLIPAEQAFARAMEEDPGDIESVQMRGLALYRLGRPAAAIPYLERIKQWTPNANADANYVLGLCYLNSQRFDDARVAFANQFGVGPATGPAYLLLAKMLMTANLPEAAADAAKKALDLSPKLPMAHFMLGEFYLFKSDTERAQREFEQEREINPANSAIYDRLGDVYIRSGKYQEAQESLAKAISLDTSSTGPFIQMGKVLLRRNDPQTSLLYLQHAEKMDPGNYITHTLLSQAYRSLGREEDAKKEIDAASKIHAESQLKLQPVK
jgi:tetratricopeptide (TPR) repeat protein